MNRGIIQSDAHYQLTNYKEALRTCFFEYQDARDKYRELSGSKGMHKDLILKFIETQTIILAPLCTHTSEFVWTNVLKKDGSVMNAHWPQVDQVDEVLLKSFSYLLDVSHAFRLRLKTYQAPPKGKDKKNEPLKATHATVFVAKKFPLWQSIVLSNLKELYEVKLQNIHFKFV